METSLTTLLVYSITQIDELLDYYLIQESVVSSRVNEESEKYKYGLILDKFFYIQTHPETSITLTKEEEEIKDAMVEEYNIEEDTNPLRVIFRLKDSFRVDDKYILDPNLAAYENGRLKLQPTILSESVLMMLLVRYEESIARIFRYLIEKYPQAYLSDKCISYTELMNMSSDIEHIKERFVDKEIDGIMREPISNWYESFKKKQKALFLFDDDLFEKFKEVYYRRNLVVHNQGIVNETYLNYVKNTAAEFGNRLVVDKEYLKEAFSLTVRMLIDTYYGLRRQSDDLDVLSSWISDYGYGRLVEGDWPQAKCIFNILLQEDGISSADKLVIKVNYWIAIKHIDGLAAIQKEVGELDVSVMQDQYHIAKAALLNDYTTVTKLLENWIEKESMAPYYLRNWPLFIEYRSSDEYKEFVENHRDKLDIGAYESSSNGGCGDEQNNQLFEENS